MRVRLERGRAANGRTLSLVAGVVLCLFAQTPSLGQDASNLPHQQRARELLRELIEIDTTHSTGDTTVAAQAMAAHLVAAGFPEQDVQVLAERPRKGNLVVRYRGRDAGSRPVLFLAHLDVVVPSVPGE